MPTPSQRLGLLVPAVTDDFVTADLAANWSKLDTFPGIFPCTSTTRPTTWTNNHIGMHIFETDSQLRWFWDGAVFRRANAKGFLGSITRNGSTTTTSTVTRSLAVGPLSVTIPAGGRNIQVTARWRLAQNSLGSARVSVLRGGGTGVGPEMLVKGNSAATAVEAQGGGDSLTFVDLAPPAGVVTYGLYIRSDDAGGTSVISGDAVMPLAIEAIEV